MQTMTSAYANKMLKSLEEDKAFWVNKEATSSTYVAAINEEPVVPEYDYTEVVATITSLDEKIAIIKHTMRMQVRPRSICPQKWRWSRSFPCRRN